MEHRVHLKEARRIVIKIGSSSLTHEETGHINLRQIEHFVRQISDLKNAGLEVVIVSSGAQAVGISAIHMNEKPTELPEKQAVAAIGQASLMMLYQKLFHEYNHLVGQILLTKDILDDEQRYQNGKNTMEALLKLGVIPIVNENDTVSTDEIEFGDNDRLSAMVAVLIEADLLVILSDIDGLYTQDPRVEEKAQVLPIVHKIDDTIYNMAGVSKSSLGTGGMVTKLMAADMVTQASIDMIIANAQTPYVLQKIYDGNIVGTFFKGEK